MKKGWISHEQIEKFIYPEDDIEEVSLLGHEWRVLLPVRSSKSMEWGDRLLIPIAMGIYEVHSVVKR